MDTPRHDGAPSRRSRAARFAAMAGDEAKARVEQGANFAAETLADIAEAIQLAGEQLQSRDRSMGARLAGQAAAAVGGFSHSLANRSAEDMIGTVRDFGRRHPATFIAISALAGFALGRIATVPPRADRRPEDSRAAKDFANGAASSSDFAPANQI